MPSSNASPSAPPLQPPGERFNIAAHLLAANTGRPAKAAPPPDTSTTQRTPVTPASPPPSKA